MIILKEQILFFCTIAGLRKEFVERERKNYLRKMNELFVLVDNSDNEVGYCEKIEAHRSGKLHRAFSVIICNQDYCELLLQKRVIHKYHFGKL